MISQMGYSDSYWCAITLPIERLPPLPDHIKTAVRRIQVTIGRGDKLIGARAK